MSEPLTTDAPTPARSAHAAGVAWAILAALLFGVSTPLIARTSGAGVDGAEVGPFMTAALLYAGAALGALGGMRALRSGPLREVVSGRPLARHDLVTIALMAVCGAALAPVLLVEGLTETGALTSSLALNAEVLFTLLLSIVFLREPWRGPVLVAIVAMAAGGALLAADQAGAGTGTELRGLLCVLGATLFWAIDNTLSRRVSEVAPLAVVALKGALGASLTLGLAVATGEPLPEAGSLAALMAIGATGYGASLAVYLLAQRRLGAARTGSIFGLAPFIGAALAFVLGDRDAGWLTVLGAACLGVGVWLHARERHAHLHAHEPIEHVHSHRHDDGHHDLELGHAHPADIPLVRGAHTHQHVHGPLVHDHPHAPDLHHRHPHPRA